MSNEPGEAAKHLKPFIEGERELKKYLEVRQVHAALGTLQVTIINKL